MADTTQKNFNYPFNFRRLLTGAIILPIFGILTQLPLQHISSLYAAFAAAQSARALAHPSYSTPSHPEYSSTKISAVIIIAAILAACNCFVSAELTRVIEGGAFSLSVILAACCVIVMSTSLECLSGSISTVFLGYGLGMAFASAMTFTFGVSEVVLRRSLMQL